MIPLGEDENCFVFFFLFFAFDTQLGFEAEDVFNFFNVYNTCVRTY